MRLVYNGSRDDLMRLLRQFPALFAGKMHGSLDVAKGLQLRVGVALLSKVQQAFIVKSRGGTGEDGIRWPPMKPASIAQRRTSAAERKSLGIAGKRTRGLLTAAQDKRWRKIFATKKWLFVAKFGMDEASAAARAAKIAWSILKAEGAKTKIGTLGNRQVDMCRDTGRYFRSLSPGVEDKPSGADGQVFETPPGKVIVGTDVQYAGYQAKLRPLWPPNGQLPDVWWRAMTQAALRGAVQAVKLILERGRI